MKLLTDTDSLKQQHLQHSSSLTSQVTEKPTHYTYLKGFRVEQCPLFLQHKCTQHRPYTCFYWHFKNQRRRRPIRKRDGTFNYNPDVYCEKYDEQTGGCPAGDECPLVHRNAGDTEKRYHLRYFKTAVCIHETDTKGHCSKNGVHCAFAHGANDTRPPVYDLKEVQAQQMHIQSLNSPNSNSTSSSSSSTTTSSSVSSTDVVLINEKVNTLTTSLEKERLLNEDPKWNDANYVLINYKTEQCKRPSRLCRQGFACPQYHNARDKRRNPSVFKYRSTPCPNVKQGDDWLEPSVCESGDACKYCHSRTEQQFHPEVYKSSKCNDMLSTGYCPRGTYCAFAHVDSELKDQRVNSNSDSGSEYTLESYITSVLPPSSNGKQAASSSNNDDSNNEEEDLTGYESENVSAASSQTTNLNSANRVTSTSFANVVQGASNVTSSVTSSSNVGSPKNAEISTTSTLTSNTNAQNTNLVNLLSNLNLANNSQLLTAALLAAAAQQQQQQLQLQAELQLQQQQFYAKPIGAEREKPQPVKGQQFSSATSSSQSSPKPSHQTLNSPNPMQKPNLDNTNTNNISTITPTNSNPNLNGQLEINTRSVQLLQKLNSSSVPPSPNKINPIMQTSLTPNSSASSTSVSGGSSCNNNGILSISNSVPVLDLEKEKLIQDLKKQSEMSHKLETLCLQYRQWVEKLTMDVNEWKNKYLKSETEKKNLELQLLNKKTTFDNASS